ncbi:unnamed protein product [Lymnaea stagnalis]|uniref:Peptidase M12B domain-containing protein n=1 Tax=Lymnaea stagnalis TaxID=6523 RepID=A0AAV2IUG7_LYMST
MNHLCQDKMVQLFLAVNVLCQAALVVCANDITVSVSYTSHEVLDQMLPDRINVTLKVSDVVLTTLKLTRVPYLAQTVPVYSLSVDSTGQFVHTDEKIRERKNTGLFQDVSNNALIQITRTDYKEETHGHLEMTGQLTLSDTRYLMGPSKQGHRSKFQHSSVKPSIVKNGKEDDIYTLHKLTRPAQLHDTLHKTPMFSRQESLPRRRRQSSNDYFVDIVAVVDFKVYSRFLFKAGTRASAFQMIQEKYAHVFNEIDIMYGSINSPNFRIHVRLVKIVVSETAQTSTFTESARISNSQLDQIDGDKAIENIRAYITGAGHNTVTPSDHVMVFTGYDMVSFIENGTKYFGIDGITYNGFACTNDGLSTSLIHDHGNYDCTSMAARELGQSLSADYDGEGNSCPPSDQYIMTAAQDHVFNTDDLTHPWQFSPCSIAYFTNYTQKLMKTAQGVACLTKSLVSTGNIPDVSNHLLGQEILPDQQCKLLYGQESQYCRAHAYGVSMLSDICSNLVCANPDDKAYCTLNTALYGTTCGSGKVCIEGSCVVHIGAPAVDETCVFGDSEWIIENGMTCGQLIQSEPRYCYNEWDRAHCCASCKAVYKAGP